MPQLTTLVLTDGAATPANHSFAPRDTTNGVSTLIESTGVPVGDKRLSFALNRTQNGRVKTTIKLAIPVLQDQVVNGISRPSVVRAGFADVTLSFDQTSSTQERKDVLAMLASALQNEFTKAIAADLQSPY